MSRSGPAFETSTREGTTWRDRAACISADPELFFPIGKGAPYLDQIIEAKTICARCEVRDDCDRFAETPGAIIREGIWAGLTEDERDRRRRRRNRERQALNRQGY